MRAFIVLFIFINILFGDVTKDKALTDNIWLKTYQNYKNYNIIILNITKTEYKIKQNSKNENLQLALKKKLSIYKSKLSFYEKNNSFDNILLKYKFDISNITLREFIFKNQLEELNRLIKKYQNIKNQFNIARSTISTNYNNLLKSNKDDKKLVTLKEDMEYFDEYSENVFKIEQNLLETKDELEKKYLEYKDEIFTKHLFTLAIIALLYMVYKISYFIYLKFIHNNNDDGQNYKKFFSLLYISSILLIVIVRYIDDFIYIITFLSVIAAALTIATREIILNIAGSIYILFSNIIKIGDRVMVQFETKHTIGDIVDISLVKIKLNEIDDYNNIKDIKNVGRTIYIPNSYIFTKVFYNYSLRKNGTINDLVEFEFDTENNFDLISDITSEVFASLNINYTLSFGLNSLKTAIVGTISYETNYKKATKTRGDISIKLIKAYKENENIKLKAAKRATKSTEDD